VCIIDDVRRRLGRARDRIPVSRTPPEFVRLEGTLDPERRGEVSRVGTDVRALMAGDSEGTSETGTIRTGKVVAAAIGTGAVTDDKIIDANGTLAKPRRLPRIYASDPAAAAPTNSPPRSNDSTALTAVCMRGTTRVYQIGGLNRVE